MIRHHESPDDGLHSSGFCRESATFASCKGQARLKALQPAPAGDARLLWQRL